MDKMIGQRIKDRRKELGITQAQIKEKAGISTGNLSEIENGHVLPSSIALINLSKILKCSADYILFGNSSNLDNYSESEKFQKLDNYSILDNDKPATERNCVEDDLIRYFRNVEDYDKEEILAIAQMKYNRVQKLRAATENAEKAATSSNDFFS